MAWGMTAIAGASIVGGLLSSGGGGSQQSGSATSTSTASPWDPSQKYLTGTGATGTAAVYDENGKLVTPASDDYSAGTPGIMPEAAKNYTNAQYSTAMGTATNNYLNQLNTVNPQQQGNANKFIGNLFNGSYNTNYGPVGNAQGAQSQNFNAQGASNNVQQSLGALGQNDPTQANAQLLSGKIDNPYLANMQQASTNTAMNTYQNAVQDAMQNIEPQIQSGAIGAGQYGSSRQGIAEGIMGQQLLRNASTLGTASMANGASLYGNAYQNAQNLMGTTAGNLTNQGINNGQFNSTLGQANNQFNANLGQNNSQYNANLAQNNNQFNANLGLQNNSQQMTQNTNNINTGLQGINASTAANSLGNNTYSAKMQALNAPNAYANQQLSNYANLINPTAGMGGSQIATNPIYSNPLGGAVSGGLLGLGAYNAYQNNASKPMSMSETSNLMNGGSGFSGSGNFTMPTTFGQG